MLCMVYVQRDTLVTMKTWMVVAWQIVAARQIVTPATICRDNAHNYADFVSE